jgi:hypothetical protein
LFNYYDSIVLRLLDSDSDTKLSNNWKDIDSDLTFAKIAIYFYVTKQKF